MDLEGHLESWTGWGRPVAGREFGGLHLRYLQGLAVMVLEGPRGGEGGCAVDEKVAGDLGGVLWGRSGGVYSVGTCRCSKAAEGRVKSPGAPNVSGLSDPARGVQVFVLQSVPGSHLGWGLHRQWRSSPGVSLAAGVPGPRLFSRPGQLRPEPSRECGRLRLGVAASLPRSRVVAAVAEEG